MTTVLNKDFNARNIFSPFSRMSEEDKSVLVEDLYTIGLPMTDEESDYFYSNYEV